MIRSMNPAQPTKFYVTLGGAEKAVRDLDRKLQGKKIQEWGSVTVSFHCTPAGHYYPVFYCFSDESYIPIVASQGFICHR